jgi:uncharacterized protein YrzB (UPF0473 family)
MDFKIGQKILIVNKKLTRLVDEEYTDENGEIKTRKRVVYPTDIQKQLFTDLSGGIMANDNEKPYVYEYNPDLITLTDDDGKEYNFEVLDAIETDTGRYLALLPTFDDPQKMLDDSGELVIVKVGEEEGEEYYYEIEDDDEYEMIADAFVERLEDFFEIDNK